MASYKVVLKPSVEKDLRLLPGGMLVRVIAKIEKLVDDPMPRQSVKLAGAERLHRLRVGGYRIIYSVDPEAGEVVVHYVRHRREAYRGL